MNTDSLSSIDRRRFLKTSAIATVAAGTGVWLSRSQSSLNSRINIGMIGTGDRAQALMGEIFSHSEKQNVQITAICDVWQKNLNSSAARINGKYGAPKKFTRFGELLAVKDIDAVVIATPDCSHAPILIAALQAGKDVYVEKPMCIELPSANRAFDLARANNRVVQVGTQKRSDGRFIAAARQLQSGAVGKINRISAAMCINQARWARPFDDCQESDVDWAAFMFNQSKKVSFDPKLIRRWQLYRMFSNGMPGLWMTHYADSVSLLTGVKYPSSAVALGGKYVWKEDREHVDTFQALLDYPEGFLFSWGMGLGNSVGTHYTINGTEGTIDAEKWTLTSEADSAKKSEPTKIVAIPTQPHMENWLECLRSRKRPAADIQFGHQHVVATVMAATALETGQRQKYDSTKRKISAG